MLQDTVWRMHIHCNLVVSYKQLEHMNDCRPSVMVICLPRCRGVYRPLSSAADDVTHRPDKDLLKQTRAPGCGPLIEQLVAVKAARHCGAPRDHSRRTKTAEEQNWPE